MIQIAEKVPSVRKGNQEVWLLAMHNVSEYVVVMFVTLPNSIVFKLFAVILNIPDF